MADWPYESSSDRRIKKLADELWAARMAIVQLAKIDVGLSEYHTCATRDDTYHWRKNLVKKVVAHAEEQTPPKAHYFDERRANCPLCGEGPYHSYYVSEGYTLPVGLERHLEGFGRIRQCIVMNAALHLARDYWDKKFTPIEEAAAKAKEEDIAKRKQTETTYRVDPTKDPELLEQASRLFRKSWRNGEEMEWAEKRMSSLGMSILLDGNVKSYVDNRDTYAIYADPRASGTIKFAIYKKSFVKRAKGPTVKFVRAGYFDLQDRWTNGLKEKYEERIAKTVKAK